jgi:hypothetical protein
MFRSALLVLLSVLALDVSALSAQADQRVALVIGNGHYVHANALPNPPNDARAIAASLSPLGFEVLQGIDLDHEHMERILRDFMLKANKAQIALLFYAGHGIQVDGTNYLVPIDAQIETRGDLNFNAIDLDKILASLDDPERANVIILDACRDNPFTRSFAARTRGASVAAGLAAYTSLGTGSLIAFSTAPGKVAQDGNSANSPFTASLLKHIATPGIEIRQMLTRVRSDVALATNDGQVPWDNSSLRGDVYLGGLPLPSVQGPTADEVAWGFLKTTTDVAALRHFLNDFPKSPHASEATTRIAALEFAKENAQKQVTPPPDPCSGAEDHWHGAIAIGTLAAFQDHLSRFPNCGYAGLARAKIASLKAAALPASLPQPGVQPKPPKGPLQASPGIQTSSELPPAAATRPKPAQPKANRCFTFNGAQVCE